MPQWTLGPFRKLDDVNPVLDRNEFSRWICPLAGEVAWEAKDVFNPAAVVKDGIVYLLYRAEDEVGPCLGTSRIGLARSFDGLRFMRDASPVLFPADDEQKRYEWPGGTEDPRVCFTDEGFYVMTYTAYDGQKARLCVATSPDLVSWKKHGLAFRTMPDLWSKSGSIVCRVEGESLVATRIEGKYWMYWGESYIFAATSDDLITWEPVAHPAQSASVTQEGMPQPPSYSAWWKPADVGLTVNEREVLVSVVRPRSERFDSILTEPGPPAILTEEGILLLYHGKNSGPELAPNTYSVGQVLLDATDPTSVLARSTEPFLRPDRPYEITGQVGNVCFAEGLAPFRDRWLLYYGTADSKIAVAAADRSRDESAQPCVGTIKLISP